MHVFNLTAYENIQISKAEMFYWFTNFDMMLFSVVVSDFKFYAYRYTNNKLGKSQERSDILYIIMHYVSLLKYWQMVTQSSLLHELKYFCVSYNCHSNLVNDILVQKHDDNCGNTVGEPIDDEDGV